MSIDFVSFLFRQRHGIYKNHTHCCTSSTRQTADGRRHTAHGTQHTAHSTRHTAHGTRHTAHSSVNIFLWAVSRRSHPHVSRIRNVNFDKELSPAGLLLLRCCWRCYSCCGVHKNRTPFYLSGAVISTPNPLGCRAASCVRLAN